MTTAEKMQTAVALLGCLLAFSAYGGEKETAASALTSDIAVGGDSQTEPVNEGNDSNLRLIFAPDKYHRGLIQADLEAAGAVFSDKDYDIVLLNASTGEKSQLVAQAVSALASSQWVVIDSDGSEAEVAIVSTVSREVAGIGLSATAVSIHRVHDGVMAVTPIETEAAYRLRQSREGTSVSAGNTARYALGVVEP
jgi:hypothetical protein